MKRKERIDLGIAEHVWDGVHVFPEHAQDRLTYTNGFSICPGWVATSFNQRIQSFLYPFGSPTAETAYPVLL